MAVKNQIKNQKIIKEDPLLWISFFLITGFGLIILYSASFHFAEKTFGNPFYFVKRQAVHGSIGLVLLFTFRFIPYYYLKKLAYIGILISIILLAAIFITPFGHKVGGASRWLKLPFFSFQPAVFSFYAIILYLAHTISNHEEDMENFLSGIFPHFILFIIFASILYNQPDFGSIVIIASLIWIMLLAGGAKIKHMMMIASTGLVSGFFLMIQKDYRIERLISYLNPWEYSTSFSYQTTMSLKAFINGGFFGKGLGKGILKLEYLPESHTDFIFSIIGEETGFLGVLLITALFMAILIRGFKISEKAPDTFGSLLALGITSIIAIHVVINMGVTLSLLPPKGLPLPFISYGGTFLIMNMAGIGVLLNIKANSK
ncbi:MAG: putative lipid II flippase FtsW [Desulfobacteraceae bacterium]|jgi:cell division protein FtsW